MAVKKILVVTPKFPYPSYGACELDRAAGIEMLIAEGFQVVLITKVYGNEYKERVDVVAKKLGITILPVSYKYLSLSFWKKIKNALLRILQPWYLDGAAFEYSEPEINELMKKTLDSFQPDLVWFDYTYLWPLYREVKKRGLSSITRSINFEPTHFLEEDGRTFINRIKFLPKLLSEYITVRWSDLIFAITPDEAEVYRKIGARQVAVLPLRSLSRCLDFKIAIRGGFPLQIFFMGSTYNVAHNLAALKFLLSEIIPKVDCAFPGQFHFNIFGGKIPGEIIKRLPVSTEFHGHIPFEKLGDVLASMDIAVTPSLYGAGMQQKVFEPLARGFPTITSPRALAGYPFKDKEDLLLATSADDFVSCLGKLLDINLRKRLSENAKKKSREIFSDERNKETMFNKSYNIF